MSNKKYKTVAIAVEDTAELTAGQVIMPNRQEFQDGPTGMQLQQQYDLEAGEKYQFQARTVGKDWENNGPVLSFPNGYTYSAQLIYSTNEAWRLIYVG